LLLNEFSQDAAAGRDPVVAPPPLFSAFAEQWLAEFLAPRKRRSTVRAASSWLRNHLLPAFDRLRIDQISTRDVDRLVKAMQGRGLSPKSICCALSVLHVCLNTALRWNLLRTLPHFDWPKLDEPETRRLSEADAQALVNAADPGFWRTLVVFFLHTGLRFSEAAALTWNDIDLARDQPTVSVTKGGAEGT
jgi:integrase